MHPNEATNYQILDYQRRLLLKGMIQNGITEIDLQHMQAGMYIFTSGEQIDKIASFVIE
jgi:hypothetical protein